MSYPTTRKKHMRYVITVALIGLGAFTFTNSQAADPPDPLATKKLDCQSLLNRTKFDSFRSDGGLLRSLSDYGGACTIHMIYKPKPAEQGLTIKFERAGKEIVSLAGQTWSEFRVGGNVLYFARYGKGSAGCTVIAHDLTSGEKLWETNLGVVNPMGHSAYHNHVTMEVWKLFATPEGDGAVIICGRESHGDYVAMLDQRTGVVLAQRVYRIGFIGFATPLNNQ